jgi:hypothetical protein
MLEAQHARREVLSFLPQALPPYPSLPPLLALALRQQMVGLREGQQGGGLDCRPSRYLVLHFLPYCRFQRGRKLRRGSRRCSKSLAASCMSTHPHPSTHTRKQTHRQSQTNTNTCCQKKRKHLTPSQTLMGDILQRPTGIYHKKNEKRILKKCFFSKFFASSVFIGFTFSNFLFLYIQYFCVI